MRERKKDITGSAAIVNVNDMKKQTAANAMKAVQGQVPGVYITGNGAPSSPTTVRIRGIGTLNNNDPLYVIDGAPTKSGLHEINQADIESIQILKDDRFREYIWLKSRQNGVVVSLPQNMRREAVRASANAYTALSSYLNKMKMLNAEGYGRALWQAHVNDGRDSTPILFNTLTTGMLIPPITNRFLTV